MRAPDLGTPITAACARRTAHGQLARELGCQQARQPQSTAAGGIALPTIPLRMPSLALKLPPSLPFVLPLSLSLPLSFSLLPLTTPTHALMDQSSEYVSRGAPCVQPCCSASSQPSAPAHRQMIRYCQRRYGEASQVLADDKLQLQDNVLADD